VVNKGELSTAKRVVRIDKPKALIDLSRLPGNWPGRFLGEGAGSAMALGYPTGQAKKGEGKANH